MGCFSSKAKREEKYLEKHKIPRDEVALKQRAESLRKISNKSRTSAEAISPPDEPVTPGQEAAVSRPQIQEYKPKKPKLDVKDFQFLNLKGEVKVKPPGSINGQAFTISSCEDCDLYVIDACAQVTIDKAKNCRIFVGPTDGSVFIRDSINCKVAVVCRQLRTRDCQNIEMALFCRTRPIVESSSKMDFFCYDLNYEALPSQMEKAKLQFIHNFWSNIYDFTPKDGNWKLLEPKQTVLSLLSPVPAEATAAFGKHGKEGPLLVTWGDRPKPSPDYMFVIFVQQKEDHAMQFVNEAMHKGTLLRANKVNLNSEQASQMTKMAAWSRSVEREIGDGVCIGFEISGAGCVAALTGVASALGGHSTEREDVGAMFRYMGIEN